jgi:hypothetical protein
LDLTDLTLFIDDTIQPDYGGRTVDADSRKPNKDNVEYFVSSRDALTPLGPMVVATVEEGVCLLEFADRRMLETPFTRLKSRIDAQLVPGSNEHVALLDIELKRYFAEAVPLFLGLGGR